jgi:hypothetical protein
MGNFASPEPENAPAPPPRGGRGYRSGNLASTMFLAGSGDRHTNWEGRMFALALLKGYPNTTIIIFYVLASAIFVLAMYRYHRSQI